MIQKYDDFFKSEFPGQTPKLIGEGCLSAAFIVDDQIVRVRHDGTLGGYETGAAVAKFIAPYISVAVPNIDVRHIPIPHTRHTAMAGNTWDKDTVLAMSWPAQSLLAKDCAAFLAELHSINIVMLRNAVPQITCDDSQLDADNVAAAFSGYLSDKQIDQLVQEYAKAAVAEHHDLVLCHEDFNGMNSLVSDDGRLCGVFDWDNAALKERASDFKYLSRYGNPAFFQEILAQYKSMTGLEISPREIQKYDFIDGIWFAHWLRVAPHLANKRDKEMNGWILQMVREFIKTPGNQ